MLLACEMDNAVEFRFGFAGPSVKLAPGGGTRYGGEVVRYSSSSFMRRPFCSQKVSYKMDWGRRIGGVVLLADSVPLREEDLGSSSGSHAQCRF